MCAIMQLLICMCSCSIVSPGGVLACCNVAAAFVSDFIYHTVLDMLMELNIDVFRNSPFSAVARNSKSHCLGGY